MPRMLVTLMTTGLALAQGNEITHTTTSSFTQTVQTRPVERRQEEYRTRIIARTTAGARVLDTTFNLPPDAAAVQETMEKARADLEAIPTVSSVSGPMRIGQSTTTETTVVRGWSGALRTIGVTRRETVGPATIATGAWATDLNVCRGYLGGAPLESGGLTENDGFHFHFTSPVTPTGCPLAGVQVTVPDGTTNIDMLTHIHTDLTETVTTTRTQVNSSVYELVGTVTQSAPPVPTEDLGILVRYVANLDRGDAQIHFTNSGARGAGIFSGTSASTTGAICVNVYAFTPDDQLASCCSCPVTPNGLVTLSARREFNGDSTSTTLPKAFVVKLLPSAPVGGSCNNGAGSPGAKAPGLHAWTRTTLATAEGYLDISEAAFLATSSSVGERDRLASRCTALNAASVGFGLCWSCQFRPGGGRVSTDPVVR
jgi:hypothetical protein